MERCAPVALNGARKLLWSHLRSAAAPFVDRRQPVDLMREANLRATKGTAEAAADQVARWLWGEIEKRKAAAGK